MAAAASSSSASTSASTSASNASSRNSSVSPSSSSSDSSAHVAALDEKWIDAAPAMAGPQAVDVDGIGTLAIFSLNGEYYALDDKCAHGKGRLSMGDIEDLGTSPCQGGKHPDGSRAAGVCVRCPKHHHKFGDCGLFFNLTNGRSFVPVLTEHYRPSFAVRAFRVREHNGRLLVRSEPVLGPDDARSSDDESACATTADLSHVVRFAAWTVVSAPRQLSHDTIALELAATRKVKVPDETNLADCAWHVSFRVRVASPSDSSAPASPRTIERDYTPVSSLREYKRGRLRFVVKVYAHGAMTQHLAQLDAGAVVMVSPPAPTLDLRAMALGGLAKETARARTKKGMHLGIVVGGTGVTPALQLLDIAAQSKLFKTIALLDSNHTHDDILCRSELAGAAAKARARVVHTLTRASPADWTGLSGRIDSAMLGSVMPAPSSRAFIVISGPNGMMRAAADALAALGHSPAACHELEA